MFKIFGLRQALASGVRHAASHQRGVVFSEKFASEFAKCAITSVTWRDNATKAESSSYIPRTRFWISTESNRVSPSLRLRSLIIPSFMYVLQIPTLRVNKISLVQTHPPNKYSWPNMPAKFDSWAGQNWTLLPGLLPFPYHVPRAAYIRIPLRQKARMW